MSTTKMKSKLVPFDAARYLSDDAAIAEYMNAVLETGDTDLLLLALGDVARARGMAQVAKAAPESKPKRLIAAATANSKKLLAPISADGPATAWADPHCRLSQ